MCTFGFSWKDRKIWRVEFFPLLQHLLTLLNYTWEVEKPSSFQTSPRAVSLFIKLLRHGCNIRSEIRYLIKNSWLQMSWCFHSFSLFTEPSLIQSPLRRSSVSNTSINSSIITIKKLSCEKFSVIYPIQRFKTSPHRFPVWWPWLILTLSISVINNVLKHASSSNPKKLWIFHTFYLSVAWNSLIQEWLSPQRASNDWPF